MKLCFSTIGCPDWSLRDILTTAKDLGYEGIEIRSINNEVYAPDMRDFKEDLEKTKALIEKVGVKIAMLTTNAALADHNDVKAVEKAKAYIDLAKELNVPYIRVMSTDKPYFDGGDYDLCKKQYKEVLLYAEGKGVTPLMETNGLFVDTKLLKKFLDETGGGALWDTHHPFRYNDEKISDTIANLGSLIKYVHLKDSVIEKGKVAYKLMGYGDMPLKEIVNSLKENGYDGYYTFEWVKLWNKDLQEGGIVFANYANYMKRF
ncbi:MAG: sugar phosphate isomerase/epimerase [Clostridia bacterium]|nr:sugar phosphate isomerase/epimerase [Clostridia bacterium]